MGNSAKTGWAVVVTVIAALALVCAGILGAQVTGLKSTVHHLEGHQTTTCKTQHRGLVANESLVLFVKDVGLVLQYSDIGTTKHPNVSQLSINTLIDMENQALNYVHAESGLPHPTC